jgi:ribonuclease Z
MNFTVTTLGSSSAIPTATRNPTSLLVNMNYRYFLVDCGEGTQIQLRRFHFKIQKINHIFISHLHGDHFFGLIGLVSSFHLIGRKDALHLYGSPLLEEIITMQLKATETDLIYPLIFHTVDAEKPQLIYEDEERYVKSFPLKHSIPTTGFLFGEKERPRKMKKSFLAAENVPVEEIPKIKAGADYINEAGVIFRNKDITISPPKPKKFAFCSDTAYHEPVIEEIHDVNLLYHEATFKSDLEQVAGEKLHSTAAQAATIAAKAKAGALVIGHFSARYRELDSLLQEAREIFPNTWLAEDGKIFYVREVL